MLPPAPDKTEYAKRLRQIMTRTETIMWNALRDRQLGNFKFRRQVPFGPFIVDFCCDRQKFIVEIDGSVHRERQGYDEDRTKFLVEQGYRVMRISNEDIHRSLRQVLSRIKAELYSLPVKPRE